MEAISDNEADYDSDDIMGEAIYDEEYIRSRKQKKVSSSSEDEEYHWEEENLDEDDEEEEAEDSLSGSEDSDEPRRHRRTPSRAAARTKLRSVDELQSGLRRSKRSTRPRINYRQYELSDTDMESTVPAKSNASDGLSDGADNLDLSEEDGDEEKGPGPEPGPEPEPEPEPEARFVIQSPEKEEQEGEEEEEEAKPVAKASSSPDRDSGGAPQKRPRYLDLNEIAPGSGFDDGPAGFMVKDDDKADY